VTNGQETGMAIIVNGERIEDAQIHEEVERLRPSYEKTFAGKPPQEREAELLEWSQENLIERTLFQQEVRKDRRPISPEIIDAVIERLAKEYQSKENLLKAFGADEEGVRTLVERYTKERLRIREIHNAAPAPTGAQIREYYEQNKEKYTVGEQVRVVHLIKRLDANADEADALKALTQARAEIQAGAPFETIAPKHADTIDDMEDLGYIFRGQMPGEFDDIVFNLGPGQVSHVFRTRLGLHIAKVYERRPPTSPPLRDIRQRIVNDLREQIQEDAFAAYLDHLRSLATIERA
jgi:parvulin-like peptidyl-prolyl isomerase